MDTLVAANGCDSIVTTNLFLENTLTSTLNVSICTGTSYFFDGSNLATSGVYIDSLFSVGGCDSVVTLYLNIEPLLTYSYSETICEGTTTTFDSQTLSTSGTYSQTYQTAGGCDSLVTFYLFVTPQLSSSYSVTICEGQSYNHGTQTLTASGTYPEMFQTAGGCDSLVTLYLNVDDQLTKEITDSICEGEFVTLGTQTLSSTGVYQEMFQTAGGCDSLVTLQLTVLDCQALLEISNVCTPNDDGSNDTWKVSDLKQIEGCTVQIFNRWGQLMFETKDYQNDWAGTKDGEVLPDGVYYYVISCEEDRGYKGPINLMRFKK
jgi:gliding motility-associated-like protein